MSDPTNFHITVNLSASNLCDRVQVSVNGQPIDTPAENTYLTLSTNDNSTSSLVIRTERRCGRHPVPYPVHAHALSCQQRNAERRRAAMTPSTSGTYAAPSFGGPSYGGSSYGGASYIGASYDGTSYGEASYSGASYGGAFYGGASYDCTSYIPQAREVRLPSICAPRPAEIPRPNPDILTELRVTCRTDFPDVCAICLYKYKLDEKVRVLLCNHKFHQECIDKWFNTLLNCPICRTGIDGNPHNEDERPVISVASDSSDENEETNSLVSLSNVAGNEHDIVVID